MDTDGVLPRTCWNLVCSIKYSNEANNITGRFLLAFKDEGREQETWQVKFVVELQI